MNRSFTAVKNGHRVAEHPCRGKRLLMHWARRAASRAAWTAGKSRAIRTEMIAMTTRSSIKVNARRFRGVLMVLNQFSGWKISRRSARILASIDTIVPSNTITDVTGRYNPGKYRHDHGADTLDREPSSRASCSPRLVAGGAGAAVGSVARGDQRDRDIESAESLMP